MFAQPPNAVAGASGAGAPLYEQVGAPATAPVTYADGIAPPPDMSQLGGAVNVPSIQTTNVTGAPAGALGDRATPSVAPLLPARGRR